MIVILVAFLLSACVSAEYEDQDMSWQKQGSAAVASGDYRRAIEIAQHRAQLGDAEAIFTVGYLMLEWLQDPEPREPPDVSFEEALKYIYQAARMGVDQAASTLRTGYAWGRYSLPKDETMELCWRRVELGEATAEQCIDSN